MGTHTSIGDSTMSGFDPEHEAIVSTKQLDHHNQQEERGSNIKQYRDSMRHEPDYVINTSAIERAFPQFSPGPSFEEDSDDEMSIEIGRGPNRPKHLLDDSRNSMSFANSVRSSSPAVKLDYRTSQSQPKPVGRSVSKRVHANDLRKDAQIRRASLAQKENLDPQLAKAQTSAIPGSRGGGQRRTLSEMHAKARETYDGSYIADERPPSIIINAQTTRFGHAGDVGVQIAEAVDKATRDVQLETRRGRFPTNSRSQPANATYNSNTLADTETRQSFLLPDLPNLSELVSGHFEDGIPVFPRQQKSRVTRFVSPSGKTADLSYTEDHMRLDTVPIPDDERALFVSLKLLQNRVAELEFSRAEAERKLEEIQRENTSMKADKSRRPKEQYYRARVASGGEIDEGRSGGNPASERETSRILSSVYSC
jgi:hypothetical protein